MADVTLEDLQKVNARIQKLETELKEANRLHGILDSYATDGFKSVNDDMKTLRDGLKKLETKLAELEKKLGRK